jgi:3-methyladenine DNA glycosylase AlkD
VNFLRKVRSALKKSADPSYDFNRFFKTPIRAYGVRYPVLRKLAETHFPGNADRDALAALCEALWRSGLHEESVVAVMWAKKGGLATAALMKRWLDRRVSNWAQVDDICLNVLGPMLERDPSPLPEIRRWSTSKNLWTRRASAVSLVHPCRKGLYLKECLEIAERLMSDPEDLIQKACGWVLREAGRKHRLDVFRFILRRRAVMGRTALRYAIELMPPRLKAEAMRLPR